MDRSARRTRSCPSSASSGERAFDSGTVVGLPGVQGCVTNEEYLVHTVVPKSTTTYRQQVKNAEECRPSFMFAETRWEGKSQRDVSARSLLLRVCNSFHCILCRGYTIPLYVAECKESSRKRKTPAMLIVDHSGAYLHQLPQG